MKLTIKRSGEERRDYEIDKGWTIVDLYQNKQKDT
jgi:hypothetical protein